MNKAIIFFAAIDLIVLFLIIAMARAERKYAEKFYPNMEARRRKR